MTEGHSFMAEEMSLREVQDMSQITKRALEQSLKNLLLKKPLVDHLLLGVINEEAEGMTVREEDKEFIAQVYSYIFVGLMLDWIREDMKEDPEFIVERLATLIKGSVPVALTRFKV